MALQGTLADFGFADILQLIGQQRKCGHLYLQKGFEDIRLTILDGAIVRAEVLESEHSLNLPELLYHAKIITHSMLDNVNDTILRTSRSAIPVLQSLTELDLHLLESMSELQIKEVILYLFMWREGKYKFEQKEFVDWDENVVEPLRAEDLLMEGFRVVDEWPEIRSAIETYSMQIRILKNLDELSEATKKDDDDILSGFSDLFASESAEAKKVKNEKKTVSNNAHLVFKLIVDGQKISDLIYITRLGEFESCRSLNELRTAGYIEFYMEEESNSLSLLQYLMSFIKLVLLRFAAILAISLMLFVVLKLYESEHDGILSGDRDRKLEATPIQDIFGASTQSRIHHALRVYRLQYQNYPEGLLKLLNPSEDGHRSLMLELQEIKGPFKDIIEYKRLRGNRYRLSEPFQ